MEEKIVAISGGETTQKNFIEALSKEEIIVKYKGLLGIAKKAKQVKDELTEENRLLKEKLSLCETQKVADKEALLTMQEMIEEFTSNKLQLATEISELRKQRKIDEESLAQLHIEKESQQRQIDRLTEDNDSLLGEIENMEGQLKQVNLLGLEQKEHLAMLELEVNKLKETESLTSALQSQVAVSLAENKALKEKENEAKKAFDALMEKYKIAKETNKEQRQKFNGLKERFVDIYRQLKKLKECKRVLLETQHEYADSVSKWQKEIVEAAEKLCAHLNDLQKENERLQKLQRKEDGVEQTNINVESIALKMKDLQKLTDLAIEEQNKSLLSKGALQKENTQLLESLEKIHQEKLAHEEKCSLEAQELTQSYKCMNDELQLKIQKQSESIEKLSIDIDNNEKENLQLGLRLEELEAEKMELQKLEILNVELNAKVQILSNDLHKISELEQEKIELLEQIEKQKSDQQISIKETTLQAEVADCRQAYEDLQLRYEQKEGEHADLLAEMRELNEALKARGDVISRQQERQQELHAELKRYTTKVKQIEDNLIEKEQSITDKDEQMHNINREIEESRLQVANLQSICIQNEEQIRLLTEELQSLRGVADSISMTDAQSDVLSTSTMSRAEELTRLREVDESFEEKYNKLRGLAMRLKKKLHEQQSYVSEMEQQQNINSANLKKELDDCRQQIVLLQTEQLQSQKHLETLRAENQKLQSSRKQANVLNLEIEAAEKSLSDVSSKMALKIAENDTLNDALISKENTISQLRKEVAILESAKAAECIHSQELKQQIDRLQQQIKDAVHSKQNALVTNKELEQSLEQIKREQEELHLQLAKNANENEVSLTSAINAREELERKLMSTEEELRTTISTLKTAERTLEDLRVEHLAYKVKAQAVLRKNQSKDTPREREQDEELAALRANEQELKSSIKILENKITTNDKQIEQLQEDNYALQQRNNELIIVIEELRQQNERLTQTECTQLQLQQDVLRNHRQQLTNLEAVHREQLKDLELSHKQQLEQLQAQAAIRVPTTIGAANPIMSNEQSKIDFLLMEREDAEGSDEAAETALANAAAKRKISNASRRSQHDFMPLDELLNAPMQAISDSVVTINGGLDDGDAHLESMHFELQATKERLQIQETRVRHLTVLLTENEQDLAKLSQLNEMLKEELRRQERAEQREKHMHNSEYLKNVILKFLTLSNGDERTRLVPVINTILKLSRSETEMLNCVAKGQRVATETSSRGWGNFLPSSWGGSSSSGNNNNN